MSFEDEWKEESEAAIKATQETVKVTAISLFNGVILSSPVGNQDLWSSKYKREYYVGGRFRSNWFLSFGAPSSKTTDSTSEQPNRLNEVGEISKVKYSDSYVLTNNLPYAERLENGWSTQAPAGVLSPNISRVNRQISKFYAAASKKYKVE
ncbi:neck protein [Vibrio phage 1.178.O._10N.286.45.E12]|nr:neck protein [Vibrio phage 1.178.O._10N.286.45.E12]